MYIYNYNISINSISSLPLLISFIFITLIHHNHSVMFVQIGCDAFHPLYPLIKRDYPFEHLSDSFFAVSASFEHKPDPVLDEHFFLCVEAWFVRSEQIIRDDEAADGDKQFLVLQELFIKT